MWAVPESVLAPVARRLLLVVLQEQAVLAEQSPLLAVPADQVLVSAVPLR